MKLVVNDACVLIDMVDADLMDEFLQLKFELHITTLVINELDEEYDLTRSGHDKYFIAHDFTAEELSEIAEIRKNSSKKISQPDASCLYLAKNIGATLLTSDAPLKFAANSLKVNVHGSLWVLCQLVESSIITDKTAVKRLERLMKINPRLPERECRILLGRWG
jgi:predicted nucleic acid-binding protein